MSRKNAGSRSARIGLWGATHSGKTTMLAALQVAIAQQPGDDQDWILYGGNEPTSRFLGRVATQLSMGAFPEATLNSVHELSLRLAKPVRPGLVRRVLRRAPRTREFEVTVLDVGGGRYGPSAADLAAAGTPEAGAPIDDDGDLYDDTADAGDEVETLIDHLARADGIVYLFDPVRELTSQDSYLYLQTMLERVTARCRDLGRLVGGKLPHFLALCVNKIDDPVVFARAFDGAYVSVSDDDLMLPVITNEDAADFFRALCSGREAGSGPLVLGSIERHFHPGRVEYFGTSAIGFYVGPQGYFRIQDFVAVDTTGPTARIRGQIRPAGVLEPFLWLEESIRRQPPPPALAPPPPDDRPKPGHRVGVADDEDLAGTGATPVALGPLPWPQPLPDDAPPPLYVPPSPPDDEAD
jgi:hypothetical protein